MSCSANLISPFKAVLLVPGNQQVARDGLGQLGTVIIDILIVNSSYCSS